MLERSALDLVANVHEVQNCVIMELTGKVHRRTTEQFNMKSMPDTKAFLAEAFCKVLACPLESSLHT
jgi:hypothetical protein